MTTKEFHFINLRVEPGSILDGIIMSALRETASPGGPRPPYSTDPKTALRLADQFAEKNSDGHFALLRFTTNWRASFDTPVDRTHIEVMACADTAPMAICLAVLKELGYKITTEKE